MFSRREFLRYAAAAPLLSFLPRNLETPPATTNRYASVLRAAGMNPANPVNLHVVYGTHFSVPRDALYPGNIVEAPCNSSANAGDIAGLVIHTTGNKQIPTPTPEPDNSILAVPEPLGNGGSLPEKVQKETDEALLRNHTIQISVGNFGYVEESSHEREIVNAVNLVQLGVLQVLALRFVEIYGLRKIGDFSGWVKNAIQHTNSLPESGESSRVKKFLNAKMTRRGFEELVAIAITGGLVGYLNDRVLNTADLSAIETPPEIGRDIHTVLFTVPEDVLELMSKPDFYSYYAQMSLRNLNMAIGTFQAAVALSFDSRVMPPAVRDVVTRFGAAHADMGASILEGLSALVLKMHDTAKECIEDYVNWISIAEGAEKINILKDFLHVMQKVSVPVSNRRLNIDSRVRLPTSGLSVLWQVLSEVSADIASSGNQGKKETVNMMVQGVAMLDSYMVNGLLDDGALVETPEDIMRYTNIHKFNSGSGYTLYIPRPFMDRSLTLPGAYDYRYSAVAVQNGTPFFLPMINMDNGAFVFLPSDGDAHELVYFQPGSDPRTWQWSQTRSPQVKVVAV